MSIKLMSAIFETEFRDLLDSSGNVTKASTAKLVCLALADHANDEGEGAYPGLTKMERKTALSRQGIINTYDALKFNGIIRLEGESKLGTNNYTINKNAFPHGTDGSQATLLVNPVDVGSKATLPVLVKPVDHNHPLTTHQPSNSLSPQKFAEMTVIEAMRVPTLQMYFHATGFFPGKNTWPLVDQFISESKLTAEQIKTAAAAWQMRGYKRENIEGILQWARDGVPQNDKQFKTKGKSYGANKQNDGAAAVANTAPSESDYAIAREVAGLS